MRINAHLGTTAAGNFPVDLAVGRSTVGRIERLTPAPVLDLDGITPTPAIALYPIADQVADKISATYFRYGPRRSPSTRFHDLVDLLFIVTHCTVPAADTHAALTSEFRRRQMPAVTAISVPGDRWHDGYRRTARLAGITGECTDLDAAIATVGACLNPLLDGTRTTGTFPGRRRLDRRLTAPEPSPPGRPGRGHAVPAPSHVGGARPRSDQIHAATRSLGARDGEVTPPTEHQELTMTLSLIIPIVAFAAAAGIGARKSLYVPLVLIALPAPTVAAVLASIALAWLARRYAAAARPIATSILAAVALVGWFTGTGPSLQGYGAFSLLLILAGLALTAVSLIRVIAAGIEPDPEAARKPAAEANA